MAKWVIVIWIIGALYIVGNQLTKPRRALIFCQVGQGDMTLMIYDGWQMVVDTGPRNGTGRECWDKYVPWWDRVIEVVMVTHDDADHSGGVGELTAGMWVEKLITDGSYRIGGIMVKEWVDLGSGDKLKHDQIELEILDNPKNRKSLNDTGLMAVLSIENWNFWLMADADLETEQRLIWQKKFKSDGKNIIKISHHGSPNGTSDEIVEAIRPAEAIISVGKNRYGHPSNDVILRLKKAGAKIRRTDMEGDVVYLFGEGEGGRAGVIF